MTGPPGTTRSEWEDQGPHRPSSLHPRCSWPQVLPLPRVPTSTAHLIFCSHFTELYKERTQHGGEGLVLQFCWLVCLFNLIICKVTLSLFTLFSSYLTSVWKKKKTILVTVHFFSRLLIMTTINYQFCVGGCVWCQLFPSDVTDQQTLRDTSTPTHTHRDGRRVPHPQGTRTAHSLETTMARHKCSQGNSLPHACLGPAGCLFLILMYADSCQPALSGSVRGAARTRAFHGAFKKEMDFSASTSVLPVPI